MEVVCLILSPMLASQPCSRACFLGFDIPTSHFLLKMFFLLFLFPLFFFSEWYEYFL